MVGTWWNHEIVKAKAQISAISGRIIEQKVNFLGKKQIKVNGKTYDALHFKFLSSDETLPDNKKLNTDIWYDAETLIWLKAQFIKQGNWEYRLRKIELIYIFRCFFFIYVNSVFMFFLQFRP